MIGYILTGLIFFILGITVWYWHDKKIINAKQEYDQAIQNENHRLTLKNEDLFRQNQDLENNLHQLQLNEQQQLGKLKGLDESLRQAEESAKNAADRFYNQNMQLAQERFQQAMEIESIQYQKSIENFQKEMETIQTETVAQWSQQLIEKQQAIKNAQSVLNDMQAKVSAAVDASKRAEEMINKQNFYRIQLSEIDIDEIEKLRSVEPYLRDKEPLNKVIWKVYYEKPTNDLIGRVIGSGTHTGIYKITHINSQKCYVGQAANLGDRWKQHIKRGVGADAPTRNKLYPAMRELGPENFTFEVIEECDRSLLDSREDYWQEYFKAKEFGYSIK